MSDYRLMYDRNYFGHLELPKHDMTITITKVVGGELIAEGGRKSKKPVISFKEHAKPLALNKTNGKTIAAMYGNEVANWVGKRVTLYKAMTRDPSGGGQTECVRIRPTVPTDTEPARPDAEAPTGSEPGAAQGGAGITVVEIEGHVKRREFDEAYDLCRSIEDEALRDKTKARIDKAKEYVEARK